MAVGRGVLKFHLHAMQCDDYSHEDSACRRLLCLLCKQLQKNFENQCVSEVSPVSQFTPPSSRPSQKSSIWELGFIPVYETIHKCISRRHGMQVR